MPEKNTNELINHLLFHKALISESDGGERIEEYLQLVRNIDSGMHIAISDEFEKSISLVFELVMEQHFNPWDIDLIKFSKLYLKKIRKEKEVDLITAGKIVFMAWSILKLQSDELLTRADVPEEEEFYFEGWNIMPEEFYNSTEALDYTQAVVSEERIPIKEKIRHKKNRPVTLMELVSAFSEAKKDVKKQKILNERRAQLRELMKIDENFDEKVHKEDLEEDIYVTWQRICMIEEDSMLLDDLIDGSQDDLIARFVSILFLAMDDRIRITQRRFPYGEIVIKNITPVEDRLKVPTVELVVKEGEAATDKPLADGIIVT
ncbi:MAG: segregation/condensation protein A [Methanomassiliicoccales archaeon]|nr:MAG: segregation/condensation protein A [Methanomassiliicoccales archaeon]